MNLLSRFFRLFYGNGEAKAPSPESVARMKRLDAVKDETVKMWANTQRNFVGIQEAWKSARPSNGNGDGHAHEPA